MEDIKKFIGCGNEWVDLKARHIVELQEMHANGEISDSEFAELVEDIARTDAVVVKGGNSELVSSFLKAASFVAKVM